MTTAELRAHLLAVDPDGTLPVYVHMQDIGWMCTDVSVYVEHLDYWEADEQGVPDTGIHVIKIGQDDR